MKHIIAACLFFLIAFSCRAQTYGNRLKEAQNEYNKGNFKKALEITSVIVKEAEQNKNLSADELISIKSENAVYMAFNDNYNESMDLFDKLLAGLDKTKPQTKISVRKNYGNALAFFGYFRDALLQFEIAYELCKTTLIEKDEHVSLLSSLAQCCQYLYDFKRSEKFLKEAIATSEKYGLNKTSDHAALYSTLGLLYKDMLLQSRSLDAYTTADKIFAKQADTMTVEYANFLLDHAGVLSEAGMSGEALSRLFRTRNIHLKLFGENSPEYAVVLNNIGHAYSLMNKFTETEQYFTRSIQLKKRIPGVKILSYLNTQNNLMLFYKSVGRNSEAKEMMEEIERGLKDPNLDDTLSRGTFAQNLGIAYQQFGNREKALKYFNDAIVYYDRVYGPGNEISADVYVSLSLVYVDAKEYEKGTELLKKAIVNYTPALANADANSVYILCNTAAIAGRVGAYTLAEQLLEEASGIIKRKAIADPNTLEQFYITKANNAADLKQVMESMTYFNKYIDLKYAQIEEQFSYMSENEKLAFVDNFDKDVKTYFAVTISHIEKYPQIVKTVLNFRLRSKALLLNNLTKIKTKLLELNDPVLNKKFETLKSDRESITKLMNLNTNDYPDALEQVEQLKREANLIEKEISLKLSTVSSKDILTWENVQKELGTGEAAIEIIRTNLIRSDDTERSFYSYLIIPQKGDPFPIVIDKEILWEDQVLSQYRNSIDTKQNDADLYKNLWKHVNDKLADITTLYISPDGIYNQVNLNTLFNSEKNAFLLEEKNIHYITTLKDLISLKQNALKKPANATLVGNPKFDYDLTKLPANKQDFGNALAVRGAFGFQLDELPGTKTEVETINTLLQNNQIQTSLLTEENANEAAVKKVKDPDILHFATHGFFLEDFSEDVLADYSRTEQDYFRNPMMRSGIFLAGANKTYSINTSNAKSLKEFEDGTLTAFEAMDLQLDKTELVILSACQTGLGKVKNGEGVFGLQRAFKLAGAKAIIMSLWPVSDEATKELMIHFYEGWTKTGDLYASFKNAQLEVKKKFPEPYYWGAFVLSGK
jgi:CHAT domain-containing protein